MHWRIACAKVGFNAQQQCPMQVCDEDGTILGDYLADLIVEKVLLIELKTAKALAPEHEAQVLSYLERHVDCSMLYSLTLGRTNFK